MISSVWYNVDINSVDVITKEFIKEIHQMVLYIYRFTLCSSYLKIVHFENDILDCITRLENLEYLNLDNCIYLIDIDFIVSLRNSLSILSIKACTSINRVCILAYMKLCKSLTSLNINYCSQLNSEIVKNIIIKLPLLKYLYCIGTGEYSPTWIINILHNNSELIYVDFNINLCKNNQHLWKTTIIILQEN